MSNNRVLVVDDDQQLLDAYVNILGPQKTSSVASDKLSAFLDEAEEEVDTPEEEPYQSFDVVAANQGEEGVAQVQDALDQNCPFAVAFIDIRMPPGIDGLQTAKQIRALDEAIYIIIVTAYSDRSVEEIQRNLRHDVVLARKPMTREEIFQQARNACISWCKDRELEDKNRQLEEQIEIFNKFVPKNFIHVLDDQEQQGHIALGACKERAMTVMFSDIRSFTAFSESISPSESFRFINSYLGHMGPIIREHDGFIDKYMGDGIMALFEDPTNAVATAVEMSQRLYGYNEGRQRAGYIPIAIGVGINVGPVMMGTIGESDRMDTTVIGDTVNLAARTEALTKQYGAPVLLSEMAVQALKDDFPYRLRLVDYIQVRGKSAPMAFHEILDAHPEQLRQKKLSILPEYVKGVQYYHAREMDKATQCFQACLAGCPEDVPTRIFLQRCWGMAGDYASSIVPSSDA
ncbi:adenylate/guanylate cyclase domain-containing protein [Magnetococcus sp. PR-3]|uniref:adenylate/guanylate cyclase domain-containing protein n=1 Tax=Magnetococcus sp. PR-3 TaxID=3120355 RepID=UPI002FCE0BE6